MEIVSIFKHIFTL